MYQGGGKVACSSVELDDVRSAMAAGKLEITILIINQLKAKNLVLQ